MFSLLLLLACTTKDAIDSAVAATGTPDGTETTDGTDSTDETGTPGETGAPGDTGAPDDTDAPDDTATSPGDTAAPGRSPGRYFPDDAIWYTDVSDTKPHPDSSTIISWLDGHGWGYDRFQIDFGIQVLHADKDTEFFEFETTPDFYTPDCDHVPVPLPEGGNLEWEDGYTCESDGDCHLIVVHEPTETLYEMWRADVRGDRFRGGCLAVWDMNRTYGAEGRGMQCTSADAAGFPIAPLLFTADEIAAGSIDHAIRFILPNAAMRAGVFVAPATHAGGPSGPDEAPPYGVRLRLRADYPLDGLPNDGARVLARALQTYGMFLSDGGNIALTAMSDRDTVAKWDDVLGSRDLEEIRPADFEVVELGPTIPLTYDCARAD